MNRLLIAALFLPGALWLSGFMLTDALAQKQTATAPRRAAASVAVTQTQTITIIVTGGFPTAVTCNPPAPAVADTVLAGTLICALSATMSDGTPFLGTFGLSGATAPGMFKIGTDGKSIVTARALTPADVAGSPYTLTMSATQ